MSWASRVARRARKLVGQDESKALFRGNSRLFEAALRSCQVYGEYGCGQSTIWSAKNSGAIIVAVDSSPEWIDRVKAEVTELRRLNMIHVDLGPLGDWGRPVGYTHRRRFTDYISAPWSLDQKPDVILVDGRFRVACFLYSLLAAKPGSIILFDDYIDRPHYHLVEEFVALSDTAGTQACFVVPDQIDRKSIEAEIAQFEYVID